VTFEPLEAQANPPPLHRLTMLADDRASGWLPVSSRALAALAGVPLWLVWSACVSAPLWMSLVVAPPRYVHRHFGRDYPALFLVSITLLAVAAALFPTLRRAAIGLRNRAMLALVRRRVHRQALPIDDLRRLDGEPEGRLVSLVGWVHGRQHLGQRVDGKRCIGLALGCRADVTRYWRGRLGALHPYNQPCSEIVEVLHDFDLVDEHGVSVPVLAAGARLIGERNVVAMGDDDDEMAFIRSLNLPANVTPLPAQAYAVRDGDPVLVIGFRTTTPASGRTAVASGRGLPLLIYPIPAERNARLADRA
jgi:hypothetical protein